jgi:uncharacterized integral membrane protein
MCKINKTEFEEAYRKFPPGKLERFFLKNLSVHSISNKQIYVWIIILLLIIPLLIEITICVLNLPHFYRMFPNILYAILMAVTGIFWAKVLYNKRIRFKKIQEYLGITKEEFKEITEIYFYNRYSSTNDYITFHSKNK